MVSGARASPAATRRSLLLLYAAVAAGSVVGSVLRWSVSGAGAAWLGGDFPWGTAIANVSGSWAIGLFARLSAPEGRLFAGPRMRHFAMTGVCGGYTTFSVLSIETLRMIQDGMMLRAMLYAAGSLAASLAAVWLGDALAARFNRLRGAAP